VSLCENPEENTDNVLLSFVHSLQVGGEGGGGADHVGHGHLGLEPLSRGGGGGGGGRGRLADTGLQRSDRVKSVLGGELEHEGGVGLGVLHLGQLGGDLGHGLDPEESVAGNLHLLLGLELASGGGDVVVTVLHLTQLHLAGLAADDGAGHRVLDGEGGLGAETAGGDGVGAVHVQEDGPLLASPQVLGLDHLVVLEAVAQLPLWQLLPLLELASHVGGQLVEVVDGLAFTHDGRLHGLQLGHELVAAVHHLVGEEGRPGLGDGGLLDVGDELGLGGLHQDLHDDAVPVLDLEGGLNVGLEGRWDWIHLQLHLGGEGVPHASHELLVEGLEPGVLQLHPGVVSVHLQPHVRVDPESGILGVELGNARDDGGDVFKDLFLLQPEGVVDLGRSS